VRRRDFIRVVGGAAATWPLAARAQQREPLRRIAVLEPIAKEAPGAQARYTAFLDAFDRLGWTDGRNVQIVARWGGGNDSQRANMPRNWWHLPQTSFWPVAAPLQR
jgi:hypothetical protein